MQIAILSKNNKNNILNSLVPVFGDSFFTLCMEQYKCYEEGYVFSSPCLGILFSHEIPDAYYCQCLH